MRQGNQAGIASQVGEWAWEPGFVRKNATAPCEINEFLNGR